MLDILLARAKMRGFGLDIEPKTVRPVDEERQRCFGSKEMKVEDGNLVDEFGNLLLAKEMMPGRRHRLEG